MVFNVVLLSRKFESFPKRKTGDRLSKNDMSPWFTRFVETGHEATQKGEMPP
jgi:hypothetical protein